MAIPGQDMDVQTFFNRNRFSGMQWLTFALCFLVVLLDGFDTAAIGYIAPSLIKEWGVTKPALAPVLSAALFVLAAGALLAGPLADRLGRKRVLTGSVLLFGVACLASAYSRDLTELSVLRFITGVGLGAAMPTAVTLTSEYCPEQRRSLLTNAMFCGFPLGAAFGGFLASWMIPHWGWRSVLELGGYVPLALGVLMLVLLPESVRYLISRNAPVERVQAILRRVSASADQVRRFVLSETRPDAGARQGLGVVFSPEYRVGTLMLWVGYFMGLVVFYALINWMPVLFAEVGLAPQHATLISALFPLGGVGAVFFGWLMDRFNANRIIALGYALTAVSIYAIGQAAGNVGTLVVVVFVAGTIMNTAQSSMPALAAAFYPTSGRATGVSWMLGVGRLGGIAGSFLVAQLSALHLGFSQIFAVVAVPGLIAMAALLVKQASHPDDGGGPSVRGGVSAH